MEISRFCCVESHTRAEQSLLYGLLNADFVNSTSPEAKIASPNGSVVRVNAATPDKDMRVLLFPCEGFGDVRMRNSGDPSFAWVTVMKAAVGICVALPKGW